MENCKKMVNYRILNIFINEYSINSLDELDKDIIRVNLTSYLSKKGYGYIDFRGDNKTNREFFEYVVKKIKSRKVIEEFNDVQKISIDKKEVFENTYCVCSHCTYRLCPKHLRNRNPNKKIFLEDFSTNKLICKRKQTQEYRQHQSFCQTIAERNKE